ncbi:hypothetical protein C8R46DRAFT_1208294 [Mycena filopes]|nr:hypothetical protein C8R46DRAFT_1208294 [Mycena filopes]
MDKFVFTFQLPSVYQGRPTTPTPAPPESPAGTFPLIALSVAASSTSNATSAHGRAQARYRSNEREKARDRMRKLRGRGKEFVPETYTSAELRALSSKDLRASRTWADFRDYIREFMFWVVVDDDDPEEVAAYNRFIYNNSPSDNRELSDEDAEFLFRHICPEPQGIDVEEDTTHAFDHLPLLPCLPLTPKDRVPLSMRPLPQLHAMKEGARVSGWQGAPVTVNLFMSPNNLVYLQTSSSYQGATATHAGGASQPCSSIARPIPGPAPPTSYTERTNST